MEIYVKTRLKEVGKALLVETPEGEKELLLPDTIVLAVGLKPDSSLYEVVSKVLPQEKLHVIWRC
ncbi:hypothetical protein [Thermoanaerobacter kivui]|uniref:hypothetical protein n=1 Tax=Thermoanaerobacter kivui TaxID=2325 RepID=UPI000A999093|nr:hypothetical protein [Thermoanaerobacter kivui]